MISGYNAYLEKYIHNMHVFLIIPLLAVLLAFLCFLVYILIRRGNGKKSNTLKKVYSFKKKKWIKKKRKALDRKTFRDLLFSTIFISAFLGVVLVGVSINTVLIKLDLQEQSYVEYEGEFMFVDYVSRGDAVRLKFPDNKRAKNYEFPEKFNSNYYYDENTYFRGHVVYSERSRIIVDWNVEPQVTDPQHN